ncbi:hypothetical protein VTK56DRAFT_2379 [Thermocarpiscus australiensis]
MVTFPRATSFSTQPRIWIPCLPTNSTNDTASQIHSRFSVLMAGCFPRAYPSIVTCRFGLDGRAKIFRFRNQGSCLPTLVLPSSHPRSVGLRIPCR